MGRTHSKPAVVRVRRNGVEQWLAIFGSGSGNSAGEQVGHVVRAVDLTTGEDVWSHSVGEGFFVSTDISAAETDDEDSTAIDGYVDRVLFADSKGRVWKLDAATGTALGPNSDGSLFSTAETSGALGVERPIGGTLLVVEDPSKKLMVYFGTGGIDEETGGGSAPNGFYAVHVDTGTIRNKIDASTGLPLGIKFYGGIIYNNGQIIFARGQDLSGLSACTPAAGEIVAIDAVTFNEQFVIETFAKIVAPIFATGGRIFLVSMSGRVMTSGGATTPVPDGTQAPNVAQPESAGGADQVGSLEEPFEVISWRQVL